MEREFDFVVYGASGYTGQYVVEELYRVLGRSKTSYKFAIAGRNQAKLNGVLTQASNNIGEDFSGIQTILADSSDVTSLNDMARRTHVLLNCVGPYRLYGEAVVKACVENGTGHVDVSGEPQYLEEMVLKYHSKAVENGCYVVGACGFDSIPCDLGMHFTRKQYEDGELSQVESIAQFHSGSAGYSINSGTYQTLLLSITHRETLRDLRKQLYPDALPKPQYKLTARSPLSHHEESGAWLVPFMGSDRPIANRTNYYLWKEHGVKPVQLQTYFRFTNLLWTLVTMMWAVTFGVLAMLPFMHTLLQKHVSLFSCGLFSEKGPTREQVKQASFSYWFYAKGWRTKAETHLNPPDHKVVVKCSGPDPGYITTAAGIVTAAVLIREEHEKMPSTGGVYTSASAFADTSVFERLAASGIVFKVIEG